MTSPKKLLVGTDFSDQAERAVVYALDLARALGAEVTLLHAYELPVLPLPEGAVYATAEMATRASVVAQAALDAAVERCAGSGVVIRGLLRDGAPHRELQREAEALGADLIVVGTHGRTGL
ncbi:MAG: universal stress protein, partial [Polyangiaceae bacterium]|nr:universal stress protein [Polyangiaceae bacterium]